MWLSPGPGPDSKCSQTVEVGCSCSELKPCQREIATDEIQEKKNYRERTGSNSTRAGLQYYGIKSRVSVRHRDWRAPSQAGSATQNDGRGEP